jgi:hypothetical protein
MRSRHLTRPQLQVPLAVALVPALTMAAALVAAVWVGHAPTVVTATLVVAAVAFWSAMVLLRRPRTAAAGVSRTTR